MDIKDFQDPDPRASAGQARLVADQLRQQQGRWAVIEEHPIPQEPENATPEQVAETAVAVKKIRAKASSRASLIKQGRVSAFQSQEQRWPGTFTAVSRTVDVKDDDGNPTGKKIIRVFAKYLGEEHAFEPSKAKKSDQKKAAAVDGSGPSPAEELEAVPVDQVVPA